MNTVRITLGGELLATLAVILEDSFAAAHALRKDYERARESSNADAALHHAANVGAIGIILAEQGVRCGGELGAMVHRINERRKVVESC